MEHVRQVVRFDARLPYVEGRDKLLCKDAGHPPGCRDCKTCHFCRCSHTVFQHGSVIKDGFLRADHAS